MRDSTTPERLVPAGGGSLLVFVGVLLAPLAPPLGLALVLAGFLPLCLA